MLNKFLGKAETGKLIITAIAVCVDPTGIAAAGFGADAVIEIRNKLLKANPDLVTLSKEIDAAFRTELAEPRYNKPDEAREVLPQMLAKALSRPGAFVKHGLDADAILHELTKFFESNDADADHRRPEMIDAFKALYGPLLHIACDDPRLEAALRPALYREDRKDQKEMKQDLKAVLDAVTAGQGVPLEDLKTLAAAFGEHSIDSKQGLETFLTQKAEEYRSYRTIIKNIDPRIEATHNLKAAAQDAAENLDFDEVETLLSRVAEVEAEIFASTQEARAQNALLRNRPDQAFQILTVAAEAFREISVEDMAQRRDRYREALYQHGLRYGGAGLPRAIDVIRPAIEAVKNNSNKVDWAGYTQNLAVALKDQGIRTDGPHGTALLAEAVTAYREALTVFTNVDHPVDWATTTQNLAGALQTQGIRTDGPDGTALLAEAVTAYREALTVRTKADHPMRWAETMKNMALAEETIADHGATDAPFLHLRKALSHVDDALTVFDAEHTSYEQASATRVRERILAEIAALDG